ncbi:MAG: iron-containing alcohol dehydrogenase [Sedimentisphaerales bacterium]|nr:iron-containing alcohol dehydrogenase [Sedimentisphaerales bacterium]
MRFEFSTAQQIVFGPATAAEAGRLAALVGQRAFVVLGRTAQRAADLFAQLTAHGVTYQSFHVTGEPTVETAQAAVASARQAGSEIVIACGGGSVIDTGKVAAAMLNNEGELLDYLEVVGRGQPLPHPAAPHVAIPTTAGTGAEVTRNAVLGVPEHRVKVSMRGPFMLPRWALVDPLLTHSMPPALTASTGLDALTQLAEAFVSNQANPLTDGICREGLRRAGRSLARAFADGSDATARENMALASLFSGLALANAKLGAVHGFAGPLGGLTDAPHGVICGKLLPFVMETNVRALQEREPDCPALARFDEIGRILTGNRAARAGDAVAWTQELCATFSLPGLRAYGLTEDNLPTAVAKAKNASSMRGNPIALQDDELTAILEQAID